MSFKQLKYLVLCAPLVAACGVLQLRSEPQTTAPAAAVAAPGGAPAMGVSPTDMAPTDMAPIDMAPPERALGRVLGDAQELTAAHFHGMAAADLERVFGVPDFKRVDPPAQLWQYRRPGCRLDVFLYAEEGAPGRFAVAHVAAEGPSVARIALGDCLIETLKKPS